MAVLLSIPITLVAIAEYRSHLSCFNEIDDKTVVVCCDSQTETSLNPEYFPELFNFSLSSAPVEEYVIKVDDVLRNANDIELVIFDISPMKACCRGLTAANLVAHDSAKCYCEYFLLHPFKYPTLCMAAAHCFTTQIVKDKWLDIRHFYFRRKKKYSGYVGGGFRELDSAAFVDSRTKALELASKKASETESGAFLCDDIFRVDIAHMIKQVKGHGKEFVFITIPLHQVLRDKIGQRKMDAFRLAMRDYCSEVGCEWIDYSELQFPDECWYDANHLNSKGAKIFTIMLRDELKRRGLLYHGLQIPNSSHR